MKSDIIADLKDSYGLIFHEITPVMGGLMNLKWKISTDKGELLIKQYSMKRFRREYIATIESRLRRQIVLEKNGVPCPRLWQCGDHIIRCLDDETVYMVMDFCPGKIENADTITITQMHSLGEACAIMHGAFACLPEPSVKSLPTFGGYTADLLRENFAARTATCPPDASDEYRRVLLAQEPILHHISAQFFDRFPKGFAHEDFHSGNILFDADGVSAIVDFDRNCYSYIWHDIGRALLSFAWEGGRMNSKKVGAFLNGYSRHAPLTRANIADALRLTWCIETPWWIQPDFFGACDEIPRRFRDEMLWLTEHWFMLDALICPQQI